MDNFLIVFLKVSVISENKYHTHVISLGNEKSISLSIIGYLKVVFRK